MTGIDETEVDISSSPLPSDENATEETEENEKVGEVLNSEGDMEGLLKAVKVGESTGDWVGKAKDCVELATLTARDTVELGATNVALKVADANWLSARLEFRAAIRVEGDTL
jgi:hypothetical protein